MLAIACRCLGAPELMDAKNSVVPFVGDEFTRSVSNDSKYSIIGQRNTSVYVLILGHGSTEIASYRLPKKSEVHSLFWTENDVWFLVRMRTDNGSRAAAIGHIDLAHDKKPMILHDVVVGRAQNGMVFDILGVEKKLIKVVCRFKEEDHKRYKFVQGYINCSELKKISEKDFWNRYGAATAIPNKESLRRVPE
jgi:hypothetical protein